MTPDVEKEYKERKAISREEHDAILRQAASEQAAFEEEMQYYIELEAQQRLAYEEELFREQERRQYEQHGQDYHYDRSGMKEQERLENQQQQQSRSAEKITEAMMDKVKNLPQFEEFEKRKSGRVAEWDDQEKVREHMREADRVSVNAFTYFGDENKAYADIVCHKEGQEPIIDHVTVRLDQAEMERRGITATVGMNDYVKEQIEKGYVMQIREHSMLPDDNINKAVRTQPMWMDQKREEGRMATYQEKRYIAKQVIENRENVEVRATAKGDKAFADIQYPSPQTGEPEVVHVTVPINEAEMERRGITPNSELFNEYVKQQVKENKVSEIREQSMDRRYDYPERNTMKQSMEYQEKEKVRSSSNCNSR